MSPNRAKDPMEDFLTREKAALEALEIQSNSISPVSHVSSPGARDDNMQIDEEPMGEFTSAAPTSLSHSKTSFPGSGIGSPTLNNAGNSIINSTACASTSPTTNITRGSRPETAAMQQWKKGRNKMIVEREAAAEQVRGERHIRAKNELTAFMREWQEKVEGNRLKEREAGKKSIWDLEETTEGKLKKGDMDWKKVIELIETLPKPAKDTTRLLSIIRSLQ